MATQLSSLNLDSYIFQLRQRALDSQGVFGYIKTLIRRNQYATDEIFFKSLLFKAE